MIMAATLVKIEVVEETDENGETSSRIKAEPTVEFKTDVEKFLPAEALTVDKLKNLGF